MSTSKLDKVHATIHAAAAIAAGIAAGLAQLPGTDAALIVPIQTAMIVSIAQIHGRKISEAAGSLVATFTATIAGRTISQFLVGWIPFLGNAINASTAAGITEAVGWSAHEYFQDLGEEPV